MAFNLSGSDGSAKCNIVPCNHGSFVWGVLFSIPPAEQSKLDAFEGLGKFYDRVSISVVDDLGAPVDAFTYVGLNTASELLPFDWYRHHVYTGALEAGIPEDYLQQIEMVGVQDDLDSARRERELSIYLA